MTYTPVLRTSFELNTMLEVDQYPGLGSLSASISTAGKKTGSRGLRIGQRTYPYGKSFSSTLCVQSGCFIWHIGLASNDEGILILVNGNKQIIVSMDEDDDLLRLYVDGNLEDSVAYTGSGIENYETWHHIGIYAFADSTNGRVGFYLNGTLLLEFDGDTGTGFTGCYYTGELTSAAWNFWGYLDDMWVDISSSEETEVPPESWNFPFISVDGDGSDTDWTLSTGSVHYENIDETTPDGDTTYNYADAIDQVDGYTLADYAIPAGFAVDVVIPVVVARKTSASTNPTLLIGLNENSTDDYATAQNLTTTYAVYFATFENAPDSDPWDDTNIDATVLKLKSGGTF